MLKLQKKESQEPPR